MLFLHTLSKKPDVNTFLFSFALAHYSSNKINIFFYKKLLFIAKYLSFVAINIC
jgi:hypothetical protein